MLNGIIRLIGGQIKNAIVQMSEYFLKPKSLGGNVKVELDLSSDATEADFKNATGVDTLDFPKKTDLANLMPNVGKLDTDKLKNLPSILTNLNSKRDKLDTGKLETTPDNLSKQSNVVKKDVVKKTEYYKLVNNINNKVVNNNNKVNKVNTSDTSNLVKKTDYNTKIVKLKIKLIQMMINVLLLKNLMD